MKTNRVLLGISSCAMLLATAQAWGAAAPKTATPMPVIQEPQTPPPSQTRPDQTMPNQDQSKVTTYTGTVVKDGEQYVLRDSSGSVYKLDDSSRAQAFEGKTVKVTGKLDANAKMIHVDSIEPMAS
jgi:uncharacterized protein YdeI (BOF family)